MSKYTTVSIVFSRNKLKHFRHLSSVALDIDYKQSLLPRRLSNQLSTLRLTDSRARCRCTLSRDGEVRTPCGGRSRANDGVLRLDLSRRRLERRKRYVSNIDIKERIFKTSLKTYRRNSLDDFRNTLVLSLGRDRSHGRHAVDGDDHRARSGGCPSRCGLPLSRQRLSDGDGAVVEASLLDH